MGKARKKIQIVILLGVLLVGGYAIGTALFSNGDGRPEEGKEPPAFTLLDTNGQTHRLSDYRGQPVIVTFWGTFCPPCVREMPEFQRQYDKWKDSAQLEILAINLSEPDLPVANFVRDLQLTYPILRDVNRRTEREYGLRSYPTTFFIKPDGTVMEIVITPMNEAQIEERVERLLAL